MKDEFLKDMMESLGIDGNMLSLESLDQVSGGAGGATGKQVLDGLIISMKKNGKKKIDLMEKLQTGYVVYNVKNFGEMTIEEAMIYVDKNWDNVTI